MTEETGHRIAVALEELVSLLKAAQPSAPVEPDEPPAHHFPLHPRKGAKNAA